jgi:hypothetical protein
MLTCFTPIEELMAAPKKGELNKSQAIRDYIATHKRAKAQTVVEALAADGIEVSAPLVYQVRGKNRTRRGAAPKTGRGPKTSGGEKVSLETLLAAKKLVLAAGSIEAVKDALRVLEKLDS